MLAHKPVDIHFSVKDIGVLAAVALQEVLKAACCDVAILSLALVVPQHLVVGVHGIKEGNLSQAFAPDLEFLLHLDHHVEELYDELDCLNADLRILGI